MNRIAARYRPDRPALALQTWSSILFVHWVVDADVLRPLIPEPLELDTFGGKAYLGLVPLTAESVLAGRVPLSLGPGSEANLRTYVHLGGKDPGIWYFSLDASSAVTALGTRIVTPLPSFRADVELTTEEHGALRYSSRRLWPGPRPADLDLRFHVGQRLPPLRTDSLEYFLVERYFVYGQRKRAPLFRAQVHHRPYPISRALITGLEETLTTAAGLPMTDGPCSVLYSPGLRVELFSPTRPLLDPSPKTRREDRGPEPCFA